MQQSDRSQRGSADSTRHIFFGQTNIFLARHLELRYPKQIFGHSADRPLDTPASRSGEVPEHQEQPNTSQSHEDD